MTTYQDGEAHGAKAFTWVVIAAAALLLVEVTWPQAMPAAPAAKPAVETTTVSAQPIHLAQAN